MMPALEGDVHERSDAELLGAVAAGDLAALGALFDRHEPGLRRYLCRMGQPGADVDDLVQATFLEITRAAPRFDGERAGRAWIYGVASIMLRRHRKLLRRAREINATVTDPASGRVLHQGYQPDLKDDGTGPYTVAPDIVQAEMKKIEAAAPEPLRPKEREELKHNVTERLSGR